MASSKERCVNMTEEPLDQVSNSQDLIDERVWSYDFEGWNVDTLELNLSTVEKTLAEANKREEQGYVRASSVLSMNAVVLALFGTFMVWGENITDTWVMTFFAAGIFSLIISSGLFVYIVVPPSRYVSLPGSSAMDYHNFKTDYEGLLKHISNERTNSCMSTLKINTKNSTILSVGVLISLLGLWAMGSGMTRLLTGVAGASLSMSIVLGIVIILMGIFAYNRAKL